MDKSMLLAELARLRAERDRLREALKPFAANRWLVMDRDYEKAAAVYAATGEVYTVTEPKAIGPTHELGGEGG
jgi:hypothetical protein